MNELVSIIIPMHNAEKFITKTIECVINQTYKNWELIIVEDSSSDNSVCTVKKVIEEYENADKIRLIPDGKYGSAALSRNKGIEEARGRYIAFIDADDIWKSDKLEKTLKFMEINDASFAFTSYEFGDEEANPTGKIVNVPKTITYKQALSRTVIFTSTVIFDLNKLTKQQIFMPNVKSEDTATWWKALKICNEAYGLNDNLVTYRRAGKSLSSNKFEAIKRIWNLYRNVEHLSFVYSCLCFVRWAVGAVVRRL